ncbi:putative cyclic nucleotide-gated ion channel 18 [Acorus gramineus]|uniref:Cyclic nucleotide-gated ion channel 18 n=1 Tax=Acorus gramineus TaxID=55184 RepID=A0AAV9B3E2_ACOGR|nr:putative cyclic nucleotide-gated ion channel 18 [Acorus gramineus]
MNISDPTPPDPPPPSLFALHRRPPSRLGPRRRLLDLRRRILDPGSDIVLRWNRIFLVSCLVALFLDPLYFYTPAVAGPACLVADLGLAIAVTFFRTIADLFYAAHIVLKFRTAFVAPSSRVFGRGELVRDERQIARRYLRSDFVIDLAATLPLPQVILIVQVLGASWYLLAIERQNNCWARECRKENGTMHLPMCKPSFLDCSSLDQPERKAWLKTTRMLSHCDVNNNDLNFTYGMFADALSDEVMSSKFIEKYLYCLWWGLRNLSSYGQNLATSTYIGETSFAILISIVGLVLFSQLIGNMQTYLQSMTVRIEEWRVRRRDTEEWMRHRQLPQDLQERVRKFVQYKWLATRGVDEESILDSLPLDLRREIKRHLCLALVRRVPFFSQMDDQLLDAICERLVSSLCPQDTYIMQEGDPVNEMLFIIRGRLESSTTNGGRTGFFNSITLRPGDFCGEELLTWALMLSPAANLPLSTRTVRAIDEVEAFALRTEDLKFVANQFRRLHSKKLQQAFRFYSHHWRTWGACFIQAAWRRHKKRKLAKELAREEEEEEEEHGMDGGDFMEDATRGLLGVENNANASNLGATILASKFAKNTKRGAHQRIKGKGPPAVASLKMPKLMKPDEPDFSVQGEDDGGIT